MTPRNHKCPLKKPPVQYCPLYSTASCTAVTCSISGPDSVVIDTDTPEFAEFNTKLAREQEESAQPATRAIYTPLID